MPKNVRSNFPGTAHFYNNLIYSNLLSPEGGPNTSLFVHTTSDGLQEGAFPDTVVLKNPQATQLFRFTPGRFSLTLPSTERHFISRSPFFYQDPIRTFLVVPNGKYVGGHVDPDNKRFTLELESSVVPLDLPETTTHFHCSTTLYVN